MPTAEEPTRVDFDDLDVAWGGAQYLWNGKPFTGIATEMHPDGFPVNEVEYKDGFSHGFSREWYGPDQLRSETVPAGDGIHLVTREWHPNGQLQSEALYDDDILLSQKEWDEQGNPTGEHTLAEGDPDWPRLQARRQQRASAQP